MNVNGHYLLVHPRAAAPMCLGIGETLDDVYKTYSRDKLVAYNYCRRLCEDLGGWNFAITSANIFCFSVMFDFAHPETGELMRAHITKAHNHAYYL